MTTSNTSISTPSVPNTPSISSSATLVELGISKWTGRKLDKRASADVASANYASDGVANVHKKLLGNCAELKAIDTLVGDARNTHYSMTMPWSDSGLRLLTTKAYFKYHETMTEIQANFKKVRFQTVVYAIARGRRFSVGHQHRGTDRDEEPLRNVLHDTAKQCHERHMATCFQVLVKNVRAIGLCKPRGQETIS